MNQSEKEVLLSIQNLDVVFGRGKKAFKAVDNVSFDIYKGETLSLVGESGSGKTTIGRAIIRINPCAAGQILYKGKRISGKLSHKEDREVVRKIQMIFQDPAASLNERATIEYIISEGLYNFHLYKDEKDRIAKIEKITKDVGLLPEHLTRYPHEFSGGQRQRIGLARAMVMEPELVIADEPISALDVSIRAQVLNLMKKFQKERGVTYLFIAHDLSIVRFVSDRIGVIYKGDIVEIADTDELFDFPLHPYTHSLISAIPIPDPQLEKHKVLYTYDPSMHDYSTEQPELVDIGHNHFVRGSKKEIEAYKAQREKGERMKSITILSDEEMAAYEAKQREKEASLSSGDFILDTPIHDSGSKWFAILGFVLPIPALIAGLILKKKNYIRTYKKLRLGAFVGLGLLGAVALLLGLLLLIAAL